MTNYGPTPIDLIHDSSAARDYKAAAGWLWYALRNAGVPDEQIANGLITYEDSIHRLISEGRL
ncbi:hypothetical protein OG912_32265 [Streptomyces sp. NBC_00464]|uniref:hypothetical protein n=1 Tax=Streptomyces sp. NBC_00464 TaxID=2975751 RepID=UPI002E1828F7